MSNPDLKDAIFIDAPTGLQKNETKKKKQEVYKKQLFEILDIKEDDGDNINEKAKIAYEEKMGEYEDNNSPDLQEVINLTKLYGEFLKTIRPEANKVKEISTSDNRAEYSKPRKLIKNIFAANISDEKREMSRQLLLRQECGDDYNKLIEFLFENQDCFAVEEDLEMIIREKTPFIEALLNSAWKNEETASFAKKIMEKYFDTTDDLKEVPGIIYKLSKIIFGNSYIIGKECRTFFIVCLAYLDDIYSQEVKQISNEILLNKKSSADDLYEALYSIGLIDIEEAKEACEKVLNGHPEKDRIISNLKQWEEWADENTNEDNLNEGDPAWPNWKSSLRTLEKFCAEEITIKNESILNDYISALMDVPAREDLDKIEKILETIYAKKDISIYIKIQIAYVMAEFNNSRALEMSEELSKHPHIQKKRIAMAFNILKKYLQEV